MQRKYIETEKTSNPLTEIFNLLRGKKIEKTRGLPKVITSVNFNSDIREIPYETRKLIFSLREELSPLYMLYKQTKSSKDKEAIYNDMVSKAISKNIGVDSFTKYIFNFFQNEFGK